MNITKFASIIVLLPSVSIADEILKPIEGGCSKPYLELEGVCVDLSRSTNDGGKLKAAIDEFKRSGSIQDFAFKQPQGKAKSCSEKRADIESLERDGIWALNVRTHKIEKMDTESSANYISTKRELYEMSCPSSDIKYEMAMYEGAVIKNSIDGTSKSGLGSRFIEYKVKASTQAIIEYYENSNYVGKCVLNQVPNNFECKVKPHGTVQSGRIVVDNFQKDSYTEVLLEYTYAK